MSPDPSKYVNITVENQGLCIFDQNQESGYRYGPSMITNADGSLDAWFAGPGYNGQWDWIYYRRSADGGKTWGREKVVLMGTPGSRDGQSVCDPGVIKIGKYYYLGYTSTVYNQTGNCVFVARSRQPEGPYSKWDGESWQGEPAPIVYYDENPEFFGAGEPSFVEKDGILYIYVNWISDSGQSTRVYTADAASENWPSTMVYRGEAISGRPGDSLDVKYIEDYGKFVGVCVSDRMSEDSKLTFYQSDDGLRFVLCSELSEGTAAGAHNSGFSGRPNGHIRLSDGVYIGYAYGSGQASWGSWATRIQRAVFTLSDSIGYAVSEGGQTFQDEGLYHPDPEPYTMGFYGEDVRLLLDGDPSVINLLTVDRYHQTTGLTKEQRKKVSAKVWDPSIATVDPDTLSVTARKTGRTHITVTYEGFCYTMAVYVLDRKEDYYGQDSKACLMTPLSLLNIPFPFLPPR